MWKWFSCYLSGRHEFGVGCEPGAVFLRCLYCGKRSPGWALDGTPHTTVPGSHVPPGVAGTPSRTSQVLPFNRASAR
jgi:rhodanese-related sulfurtransferase